MPLVANDGVNNALLPNSDGRHGQVHILLFLVDQIKRRLALPADMVTQQPFHTVLRVVKLRRSQVSVQLIPAHTDIGRLRPIRHPKPVGILAGQETGVWVSLPEGDPDKRLDHQ
ncbi:hypothetical protein [Xenorhabdus thailandensis]|uniref:hypothetical protein n=1 Tax=Xenorhabdus thailandensis TaxID=3136255 RepID=UPI003BF60EC1